MMIRPLFLVTLLFITLSVYGNSDIVLWDTQDPQVQLSWSVDVGKMTDYQLYDMLSRYYGAPRSAASQANQLAMDVDLFNRPAGHLFFSIGGLSSRKMPQKSMDYLKVLAKTDLKDLSTSSHAPYSVLASVLTGNAEHGIGNNVEVNYDNPKDLYSPTGNFYDAMSKLYSHKQMVSASSSLEGAMVLSPHLKNFGNNVKSHYWDRKTKSFQSVSGTSSYYMSIKDYPSLMSKLASVLSVPVLYDEVEQTVKIGPSDYIPTAIDFELSCSAMESLFAEVLFLVNMASRPVPFLSFHFESLTQISTKYGIDSEEYAVAVHIIDAVIAYIQSAYKIHHSLEMTIVYLNENYLSKDVVTTIEPIVANYIEIPLGSDLWGTITSNLPHIFLSQQAKDNYPEVCVALRDAVIDYSLAVECSFVLKRNILQTPEPAPEPQPESPSPPPPPGVASQQDVALVHIVLWLVVALICAIFQSCYHLSVLDGSNEPEFKPKTYEGGNVRNKTTKM